MFVFYTKILDKYKLLSLQIFAMQIYYDTNSHDEIAILFYRYKH